MQKPILLDTGHLRSKRSCGSRAAPQLTRQVLSCWAASDLQLVTPDPYTSPCAGCQSAAHLVVSRCLASIFKGSDKLLGAVMGCSFATQPMCHRLLNQPHQILAHRLVVHAADLVLLHGLLVQHIKDHFADDIKELASGAYDGWLQQPLSAVAGIILADQFTRWVMYMGTAYNPTQHPSHTLSTAMRNKALS